MEQAAAAAFVNNVMGKLFQALGLVETYKMLQDLKPESESLLQELRMLAAAVDDELTASKGTRRTAVARAYSCEMRALTHDVEDCGSCTASPAATLTARRGSAALSTR
ncbi:unnamed protein product [Urochloa humidicola]